MKEGFLTDFTDSRRFLVCLKERDNRINNSLLGSVEIWGWTLDFPLCIGVKRISGPKQAGVVRMGVKVEELQNPE